MKFAAPLVLFLSACSTVAGFQPRAGSFLFSSSSSSSSSTCCSPPSRATSMNLRARDEPSLAPSAEKRLFDDLAKRAEDMSADICNLVVNPVTGEIDDDALQQCQDSERLVSAALLEDSSY